MMTTLGLLTAIALALQAGTTIVLGEVERDLTGDGQPEVLRIVGVGPAADNLAVTLTIASGGRTIFHSQLESLTRTVGFDGGRRSISAEEHRERLATFGQRFFAAEHFQSPTAFAKRLAASAPERAVTIADVIERGRPASERRGGRTIWREMEQSSVTIFTFSPGGDTIVAIGWSAAAGRFYRLLECC